ncbi:hypothetical protein D3C87_1936960 [compost metagenome]
MSAGTVNSMAIAFARSMSALFVAASIASRTGPSVAACSTSMLCSAFLPFVAVRLTLIGLSMWLSARMRMPPTVMPPKRTSASLNSVIDRPTHARPSSPQAKISSFLIVLQGL